MSCQCDCQRSLTFCVPLGVRQKNRKPEVAWQCNKENSQPSHTKHRSVPNTRFCSDKNIHHWLSLAIFSDIKRPTLNIETGLWTDSHGVHDGGVRGASRARRDRARVIARRLAQRLSTRSLRIHNAMRDAIRARRARRARRAHRRT